MAKKKNSRQDKTPSIEPYHPSPEMIHKLNANRAGQITTSQRVPIMIAGFVATIALICPTVMLFSIFYSFIIGLNMAGFFGWFLAIITLLSFGFLGAVLWFNARMFLPEALNRHPVRWTRDELQIKLAERERHEMPFSYIVGDYSFAPFIPPDEVPLQTGREYIVYYTPRSRLLLSIAPTDQPESADWLPLNEAKFANRS